MVNIINTDSIAILSCSPKAAKGPLPTRVIHAARAAKTKFAAVQPYCSNRDAPQMSKGNTRNARG
jgi:hypothetical protein